MASVVLILFVIALPLVLVGCFCTAFYKLRRARPFPLNDIERARNVDRMRHAGNRAMPLREYGPRRKPIEISLPYDPRTIVSTALAPVAKPLPSQDIDVKGTGGGFVQYYGTSNSNFSHVTENVRNVDRFENAGVNSRMLWEYKRGELAQPCLHDNGTRKSLEIQAPQPVYTSVNYGRWNTSVDPEVNMYRIDTEAAETWRKIEKREPLTRNSREVPNMTKCTSPQAVTNGEDFESIEINGGEPWRRQQYQATLGQVKSDQTRPSRQEQVSLQMAEARRRMEERKIKRKKTG